MENLIYRFVIKLVIFSISFIMLSTNFVPNGFASSVNDQTLNKIRALLNIDRSVSDDRLRSVLNKEVDSDVSLGNEMALSIVSFNDTSSPKILNLAYFLIFTNWECTAGLSQCFPW